MTLWLCGKWGHVLKVKSILQDIQQLTLAKCWVTEGCSADKHLSCHWPLVFSGKPCDVKFRNQ